MSSKGLENLHLRILDEIPVMVVNKTSSSGPFGLSGEKKILTSKEMTERLLNNKSLSDLSPEGRQAVLKHLNVSIPLIRNTQTTHHVAEFVTCSCNKCEIKNRTCTSKTGCFSSIVYASKTGKTSEVSYGCLHDDSTVHSVLSCGLDLHSKLTKKRMEADKQLVLKTHTTGTHKSEDCVATVCCRWDECNKNIVPKKTCFDSYVAPVITKEGSKFPTNLFMSIFAPCAALAILLALLFVFFKLWQRKTSAKSPSYNRSKSSIPLTAVSVNDNSLKQYLDVSISSGSGSGLPFLVQRTVARQIVLGDLIGKGRYGEVWRGDWQGESVAVKIFNSRDEDSWKRETQIYNTVMLRHENILGYIASDIATRDEVTCMWLVTHYHVHGSLYDYLNLNSLDIYQMVLLSYSAVSGLAHLHIEIHGMQGKPAIAHRDMKTKNILVKTNGQCCISDLGLSVLHSKESNCLDISYNRRVGTKRYMAPELLNETMQMNTFDAYKQTDMYAFGLVLWEIARRTMINGVTEDYQPPYYDRLPQDPPFEEVKDVVADECYRPQIPKSWYNDEHLFKISKLMTECWVEAPHSRLNALRVKKTLYKLMSMISIEKDDHFRRDFSRNLINSSVHGSQSACTTNVSLTGSTLSTNISLSGESVRLLQPDSCGIRNAVV